MIGQALSAITLGLTPVNGEKIAIYGLTQWLLDGRVAVKERIHKGNTVTFLLPQGSGTALRTRTTHLNDDGNRHRHHIFAL